MPRIRARFFSRIPANPLHVVSPDLVGHIPFINQYTVLIGLESTAEVEVFGIAPPLRVSLGAQHLPLAFRLLGPVRLAAGRERIIGADRPALAADAAADQTMRQVAPLAEIILDDERHLPGGQIMLLAADVFRGAQLFGLPAFRARG